jgi:hypothetical protein
VIEEIKSQSTTVVTSFFYVIEEIKSQSPLLDSKDINTNDPTSFSQSFH